MIHNLRSSTLKFLKLDVYYYANKSNFFISELQITYVKKAKKRLFYNHLEIQKYLRHLCPTQPPVTIEIKIEIN